MQLFARDGEGVAIMAHHAEKGRDYLCMECSGRVRMRAGPNLQPHYFHIQPPATCFQSQKSASHLQLQLYLWNLFGQEESQLEEPFPEIGRIADVVWHRERIIFEVQCSPISAEEVRCRNCDYAKAGYTLVWILHERSFNHTSLTAAEIYLRDWPHYFTSFDERGEGEIYDQLAVVARNKRHARGCKSTPTLTAPCRKDPLEGFSDLPKSLERRMKNWPLFFGGDLLDRFFFDRENLRSECASLIREESALLPQNSPPTYPYSVRIFLEKVLIRPYQIILSLLLERISR